MEIFLNQPDADMQKILTEMAESPPENTKE